MFLHMKTLLFIFIRIITTKVSQKKERQFGTLFI